MKQWEYKKIALSEVSRRRDEIDLLCEAGEEGWELVTILPNNIAYLKREVYEDAEERRHEEMPRAEAIIERADDDPRIFEETEVRLRDFTREPGTTFSYAYDMGDNWVHSVCLEQHLEEEPAPKVARCVEGARARPPRRIAEARAATRIFLKRCSTPRMRSTARCFCRLSLHVRVQSWCARCRGHRLS